jgi:hypothetical protein
MPLSLPRVRDLEGLPDPKDALLDIVRTASGQGAHRRARIRANPIRTAELTEDFSALRDLLAFRALEDDILRVIAGHGWPGGL